MDRKFSIPVGMAMLAALALVGMLGIFAFNAAQPAQAAGVDSATVTADPATPAATATYTFMVTTNSPLSAAVPDKFKITPPTGYTRADGPISGVTVGGMAATVVTVKRNVYFIDPPVDLAIGTTAIVVPGVTNPATAGSYVWKVDISTLSPLADVSAEPVTIGEVDPGNGGGGGGDMVDVTGASVTARPDDPGALTQITVKFTTNEALAIDESIVLEVSDDLGVPSSISASDVSIGGTAGGSNEVASPRSVIVETNDPDERYVITLFIADMDDSEGAEKGLDAGEVTVTFRQGAGITNRTEGGNDKWYVSTTAEPDLVQIPATDVYDVPFTISLSSYGDSRGEEITVVGKGFKNGTTTYFFRDVNRNGVIDSDPDPKLTDTTLCDALVSGDDIVTCTFTLSNPPFGPGKGGNYINAIDGRGKTATTLKTIELEDSMTVSPKQGSPGDSINVQLHDFNPRDMVKRIVFARTIDVCNTPGEDEEGNSVPAKDALGNEIPTCPEFATTDRVDTSGNLSFSFEIPNTVPPGAQDLQIHTTDGSLDSDGNIDETSADNITFAVGSGELQLSSTTVLANQRISISGSGFTKSTSAGSRAYIGDMNRPVINGCEGKPGSISIGGKYIEDTDRINDGEAIEVTSGGTWSAPIDLPVDSSTTVAGTRQLKVTDCLGGVATIDLTFPAREVTMTPAEGGVGSEIVITGKNFPVENDDGDRVDVTVIYDARVEQDDDDVEPDAVGSFTVILEVPEDANIPSSNTVKVEFEDADNAQVLQTFTHRVPQGTVSFSIDIGAENSLLTITANGFARYTSVDLIEFGDRDITPLPKPSTDTNGNGTFDIRIPGADPGIYIIRVEINKVIATHTFTVVSGSGASDAMVETVLSSLISEGTLDRIFRFDNETKTWEWHIDDPAFSASNNLAGLSSGDLVFIKVTRDVMVDVLGTSIALTCINEGTAAEDCWNTITIP